MIGWFCSREPVDQRRIARYGGHGAQQGIGVVDGEHETVLAVDHHVAIAGTVAGYDRQPARHAFQHGVGHSLDA